MSAVYARRPPLSARSPLPAWVGAAFRARPSDPGPWRPVKHRVLRPGSPPWPGAVDRRDDDVRRRRMLFGPMGLATIGRRRVMGPFALGLLAPRPARYRVKGGQVYARWGQRGPLVCQDGSAPCGWCGSNAGYETETDGWERCLDCGGN